MADENNKLTEMQKNRENWWGLSVYLLLSMDIPFRTLFIMNN